MQICQYHNKKLCIFAVAPFAGAWIEMTDTHSIFAKNSVAPFAGAWIEIPVIDYHTNPSLSLPSRERGLKYVVDRINQRLHGVAPFAGAWIEI